MSRPIYEPSLPRADAELGYGSRQLFRRPAPTSEGATSAALLTDFSFENPGDDVVAADTWELVTPGDGSRYFTESWRTTDGGFGVFYDGESSFLHADFAHYVAYAQVTFWAAADNDVIGAAIQFSASVTEFYPNTNVVKGLVSQIPVVTTWWGTLSDIRLWCYHSAGGEIQQATFVVRKFELNASGDFETRP